MDEAQTFVVKHTFLELDDDERKVSPCRSRSFSDSAISYRSDSEHGAAKKDTSDGEMGGSTTAGSLPGSPAPELADSDEESERAAPMLQPTTFGVPAMQPSQTGSQMYMLTVTPEGQQVLIPVSAANMPMWSQPSGASPVPMMSPFNVAPSFMQPSPSVIQQGTADSLEARAAALNAQAAEAAIAAKRAKAAAAAARKRLGSEKCDWQAARMAVQTPAAPRDRTYSLASASTAAYTGEVCGNFASDTESNECDERTTLMFRNLPNSYNRAALLNMLDTEGFSGQYTFVYLPTDFKNFAGFGYAFLGFASHKLAERAKRHFQGFAKWRVPSQKTCDVAWSGEVQGLEAYVDKYRNSPVMHDSVPDEYKPALFINGVRIPFPAPTKRIRPPRVRHMAHMSA